MGMVKIQPLTESKRIKRLQYNFAQWITSTRRTRNRKLAPIDSKGKYVKYKANYLFFYSDIFFPDSPTEVTCGQILTHSGSIHAQSCKEVPFWGPHDGRPHLGGQIPQKTTKIGREYALPIVLMNIDVIEE